MVNTPWSRFVMPFQYAQSQTGAPVSGALLYFYSSGTTTPLDTYSDQGLTIPNTNPVVADQYGIFPNIFLQSTSYRVVLTEPPTATGGPGAQLWSADPVSTYVPPAVTTPITVVIEMTVDGDGVVPTPGVCGDLYVPFACTINAAVLQSTLSGSVVVDIWAAPFVVNTPPTITSSIVASAPPTLVTSQSSIDTALTGWVVDIPAGTALRFNINSIATVTRFTMSLVATFVSNT